VSHPWTDARFSPFREDPVPNRKGGRGRRPGNALTARLVLNLSSGERKIDHRNLHLYSAGDAQFVRLAAQVLKSSSTEGSESARMMYPLSIAAASQSIQLSNSYFVPDDLSMRTLTAQKASRSRWGELLSMRARRSMSTSQPCTT
jgi:hypothetical protein